MQKEQTSSGSSECWLPHSTKTEKSAKPPVFTLLDKEAPVFSLRSFSNDGHPLRLADYKGQAVLIDFWEVWCGPCLTSMPKVQELHDRYKKKGLIVLGIINDTRQLQPSKLMVKNKHYSYPMLVGDAQLKKDYHLDGGVPLYVLIDKTGKVSFISQGYSDEIETAVKRLINN